MRVRAIPSDLIGTTTYSAWTPQTTYDLAYDMWLNNSDTKDPCQTDGTLEVMIWTDYDSRALLPAAEQVGQASVPFKVDGSLHAGTNDWSMYVSNVFQGGQTEPWGGTVWLVLGKGDRARRGTVSVDLSAALSDVGSLLQKNYGWDHFSSNYWLDTIPFGLEYGPQNASLTEAGSTYFTLKLSSYCLDVGVSLRQAACTTQD